MWIFTSKAFFILTLFFGASHGLAQSAVEQIGANSLDFRGQGSSPWCFAFAEEQYLKDAACTSSDCNSNANQWYASIFDIVRIHGDKSYEQYGKDLAVSKTQQLFNGSVYGFPYLADGVRKIRSSSCTLEKDIFYMNRSRAFNPMRYGLSEMLGDLRTRYTDPNYSDDDAQVKTFQNLIAHPDIEPRD